MIEYITLAASSFLAAEALSNIRIKAVLTLQGIKNAKINLKKLSDRVAKKGSSNIIIGFGSKTFNFHHSIVGWVLALASVIFTNISLLSFSLGLILHHLVKEKKLF